MIWKSKKQNRDRVRTETLKRRACGPERLETRRLLAADAIHVGVVYLETDYLESDQDVGSDSRGDRFILSFTGGAPGTELSEIRIRTDKDSDGISVGDPIFDTEEGGRGKGGAHGFEIVQVRSNHGREVNATAEVEDGGQQLILHLSNFLAGDRLEFTLDVDEVLRNSSDLEIFNDRLDVITSGQEFQDSILEAKFEAPHYETTHADALFANDFGDPAGTHGLELPPDQGSDVDSRPNRSAAAVASATQTPKPVEISGHVWVDNDLDANRDGTEPLLAGVEISLWQLESSGSYRDTGERVFTDANGFYQFDRSLGLMPGTYRVMQQQPDQFFSVTSVAGSTNETPNGVTESVNAITNILLPLGDTSAIDQDFAEAAPASLSGFVYRDLDNDGRREAGELGLAGIRVRLVPINTIASQDSLTTTTAADGSYRFDGLAPGTYEVIELDQPNEFSDGRDSAGSVAGQTSGVAENPGDRIHSIFLAGSAVGVEYNFAELPYGSISGSVFLAAPGSDCEGHHDTPGDQPLSGVQMTLENEFGEVVATTLSTSSGAYAFNRVPVGNYRIIQETPSGLINGQSHVGNIGGIRIGSSVDGGLIQNIIMTPGGLGIAYDFCEAAPASLSGQVYHDASNDGIRNSGEEPIAGASVSLINADGDVVATQQTDIEGQYHFLDLQPGTYSIREQQPLGFLDGIDSTGSIRGISTGRSDGLDSLTNIRLHQGDVGVDFDFGELMPTSISGRVHVDLDGDCEIDPGERTLGGVVMRLLDHSGTEVARTVTNSDGFYAFHDLLPGTYSVAQQQPEGLFEGDAHAGNVGGRVDGSNRIDSITVESGESATGYNFCELEPSSISGLVYVDGNGDCLHDANEIGLEGVTIELRGGTGQLVSSTQTDAAGRYRFDLLQPGDYEVFERQPEGYFHGGQHAGDSPAEATEQDLLRVTLGSGQHLVDYNFCEIEPSSIQGSVWSDTDQDLRFDPGEQPVPGVVVELINSAGDKIETTSTNASGEYRFSLLAPDIYTVRQKQPDGFFHGGQIVGSAGGEAIGNDLLVGIELRGGTSARDYHFPEIAPASLSGHVFQDGEDLVLEAPPAPADLRDYSDGQLTEDDRRLSGVILELRNAQGLAVQSTDAMPGTYAPGPLRVTTDSLGFYEFAGVRPGSYHILQIQPENYTDGLDTAGSTGGEAINAADEPSREALDFVARLTGNDASDPSQTSDLDPVQVGAFDAILNVQVEAGAASTDNNFSELVFVAPPEAPPLPPYFEPFVIPGLTVIPSTIEAFDPPTRLVAYGAPQGIISPLDQYRLLWDSADLFGVSWHLSVINGGYPGGVVEGIQMRRVSNLSVQPNWSEGVHSKGSWTFNLASNARHPLHELNLGEKNAIAAAGDFNGDGSDEAVIFVAGQWYVDLNGNGRWDAGDLWIQLGTELDRPVVGDWDGDGKDDIAIFGMRWQDDDKRIVRDPGLPDPANMRRRMIDPRARSVVKDESPEHQHRLLRRGTEGQLRADAVDHVFQYGERVDTPVAGDWNGDGIDQIGVFQGGNWMLDSDGDGRWTETDERMEFGVAGDEPIAGDFNGDKIDEIGVVRGNLWIIDTDGDRRITGNDLQIEVPRSNDNSQPVVGDFDGDGKDEPGYYDEAA